MSADNHVIDSIPAYALGCLDEDEVRLVERHLAACAACRAELTAYQAVVARLSLAVPDAAPPATLKPRLFKQIRQERKTTPSFQPSPWAQFLNALRQLFANPAWQPIALILIVALGVGNILLWQRAQRLASQPTPALRVINLNATTYAPQANGIIVVSNDGQHGTLVVEEMPPLGQGQQYQLWLIHDGQRTDGGVFSIDPDGYGAIWIDAPRPLGDYSAFGVTIEPAGGSPGPTGERVLGAEGPGS